MKNIYFFCSFCLFLFCTYNNLYPQNQITDKPENNNIVNAPWFDSRVLEPAVITESSTFRMMIKVSKYINPQIDSLSIKNSSGYLLYQGKADAFIKYYDDGTHGDQQAGDKVFTTDELSFSKTLYQDNQTWNNEHIFFTGFSMDSARVVYSDSTKAMDYLSMPVPCKIINSSVLPVPSIKSVAEGIEMSDYCVNIYKNSLDGTNNTDIAGASKIYYNYFPDSKDFLIFFNIYQLINSLAGTFYGLRNDISGIGLDIYDYTAEYGSSGRLQGFINLESGSISRNLFNHELLHRWAAFLNSSLGMSIGHWRAIERPSSGFGPAWGAFNHFQNESGRQYRAYLNPYSPEIAANKYNDLELYLMGLIGKSEVASPIHILENPVMLQYGYDKASKTSYALFDADGIKDVQMNDITNANGERKPDHNSSQKNFSSALIVTSDRKLTGAEFAYFDYLMRSYEKQLIPDAATFEAATGGRAKMSTRIIDTSYVPPLIAPKLLLPPNNSSSQALDVILSWESEKNALSYILHVATDKDFMGIIFADSSLSTNSKQIPGLKSNTLYFWRVRAGNSKEMSPWSEVWSFTTIEAIPPIPALAQPSNYSLNNALTTRFSWGKSSFADKYRIQLAEDNTFTRFFFTDSSITDTLKEVKNMKEGQKYFWRVSAANSAGESPFSEPWNFTTLLIAPDKLNAAVTGKGKIKLSWNDNSSNESGYIIERKSSSEFVVLDTVASNSGDYYDSGITQQGSYQYRVRCFNQFTLSSYSNTAAADIIIPNKPLLAQPLSNSKNNDLTVRFKWKANPHTERYRLLLSETDSFTKLILHDSTLADTLREVKNLSEGQKYYWRVSSMNISGESPYSDTWNFITILNAPEALTIRLLSASKLELSWTDKSTAEAGFIIERKLSNDFTVIDSVEANKTTYIDSTVKVSSTQYQYRVMSFTKFALSSYSNIAVITVTEASSSNKLIPTEYSLFQNYPNPFNPQTLIRYGLPQESSVKIIIYNSIGEVVKVLGNTLEASGYHDITFNASDITSGVYFYSLEARSTDGSKIYKDIKKMIVLK